MNKREFLEKLEERLSYELPQQIVIDKMRFYENYINDEVRKGRSPEDVIADIGDPVLIARTIVDSIKCGADGIPNTDDDIDFGSEMFAGNGSSSQWNREGNRYANATDAYGTGYGTNGQDSGSNYANNGKKRRYSIKPIIITMVVIFLFMAILMFLGTMLSFAFPVMMPFFVIMLVMWLIRRR